MRRHDGAHRGRCRVPSHPASSSAWTTPRTPTRSAWCSRWCWGESELTREAEIIREHAEQRHAIALVEARVARERGLARVVRWTLSTSPRIEVLVAPAPPRPEAPTDEVARFYHRSRPRSSLPILCILSFWITALSVKIIYDQTCVLHWILQECKISNIQFQFTVSDLRQPVGTCKSHFQSPVLLCTMILQLACLQGPLELL
jgi:hypothetical protein